MADQDVRYLIFFETVQEEQTIRNVGVEVVDDYPNALLVTATPDQLRDLEETRLDSVELPKRPITEQIHTLEAPLSFESGRRPDPARSRPYLIHLIGPPKSAWLETIHSLGGVIQGCPDLSTLLVTMRPDRIPELIQKAGESSVNWLDGEPIPYSPREKISKKLLPPELDATEMSLAMDQPQPPDSTTRIAISLFEGEEDTNSIIDRIQALEGQVLGQSKQSIIAIVPTGQLETLAAEPGIAAISPYGFAVSHNDKAAEVMNVPPAGDFGARPLNANETMYLKGTGQAVAVADGGLDTGDPNCLHPDLQKRLIGIKTYPVNKAQYEKSHLAPFLAGPVPSQTSAADPITGHGTHVAGSVLGDGSLAAGALFKKIEPFVPQGIAPEAKLYFQAVGVEVYWKTRAELPEEKPEGWPTRIPSEENWPPRDWPPSRERFWGIPQELPQLFQDAYDCDARIRIHTNSWGIISPTRNELGAYTPEAKAVDDFMWRHRDMLILFSAGNAGMDFEGPIYQDLSDGVIEKDSITPPGTAKNCLTVGACENNRPPHSKPTPSKNLSWHEMRRQDGELIWPAMSRAGHISDNPEGMAAFSSRGPTDHDRLKPDVVAPGVNILSTRSRLIEGEAGWGELQPDHPLYRAYHWYGGASMSTPLVAGAAALIRQYLIKERHHYEDGLKPSGALIKAFLVNGAQPLKGQFDGEVPPDTAQRAGRQNEVYGFGRVDVAASLAPNTHFSDDPAEAVTSCQIRLYRVQVADLDKPLRVTLTWTDKPTEILVNRLHLTVRRPDKSLILSGDVDPAPKDVKNNVQRVIIEAHEVNPDSNDPLYYVISVKATTIACSSPAVPEDKGCRQDFALVASNIKSFEMLIQEAPECQSEL